MAPLGLKIRAAIHTGEIEMREGDVGGIGVHIASRALAEAGGEAVVVTRTVRDLATGTDLAFEPLGSVGLRGVPGEWELFEASAGEAAGDHAHGFGPNSQLAGITLGGLPITIAISRWVFSSISAGLPSYFLPSR